MFRLFHSTGDEAAENGMITGGCTGNFYAVVFHKVFADRLSAGREIFLLR